MPWIDRRAELYWTVQEWNCDRGDFGEIRAPLIAIPALPTGISITRNGSRIIWAIKDEHELVANLE